MEKKIKIKKENNENALLDVMKAFGLEEKDVKSLLKAKEEKTKKEMPEFDFSSEVQVSEQYGETFRIKNKGNHLISFGYLKAKGIVENFDKIKAYVEHVEKNGKITKKKAKAKANTLDKKALIEALSCLK